MLFRPQAFPISVPSSRQNLSLPRTRAAALLRYRSPRKIDEWIYEGERDEGRLGEFRHPLGAFRIPDVEGTL
jgi:hypothetical protein